MFQHVVRERTADWQIIDEIEVIVLPPWHSRPVARLAVIASAVRVVAARSTGSCHGAEEGAGGGSIGSTGGSVSLGPGQALFLPVRPNGYSRISITNTSDAVAEVDVDGGAFRETVTLRPGETFVISEIFEVSRVRIVNRSAAATLSIGSKWL